MAISKRGKGSGSGASSPHASPWELAEIHNERRDVLHAQTQRRRKASYEARCEHLNSTHEFQLVRGEQPFGKPQVMTGLEASRKNREYERQFYDRATEPGARLYRLKWVRTLTDSKGRPVKPGESAIEQTIKRRQEAILRVRSTPTQGGLSDGFLITKGGKRAPKW